MYIRLILGGTLTLTLFFVLKSLLYVGAIGLSNPSSSQIYSIDPCKEDTLHLDQGIY